jgi:hypothetical protein
MHAIEENSNSKTAFRKQWLLFPETEVALDLRFFFAYDQGWRNRRAFLVEGAKYRR